MLLLWVYLWKFLQRTPSWWAWFYFRSSSVRICRCLWFIQWVSEQACVYVCIWQRVYLCHTAQHGGFNSNGNLRKRKSSQSLCWTPWMRTDFSEQPGRDQRHFALALPPEQSDIWDPVSNLCPDQTSFCISRLYYSVLCHLGWNWTCWGFFLPLQLLHWVYQWTEHSHQIVSTISPHITKGTVIR